MSGVAEILAHAERGPGRTLVALDRAGARMIASLENAQPDPALRIASVHHAGITGIGPRLDAAVSDWIRQAREVTP